MALQSPKHPSLAYRNVILFFRHVLTLKPNMQTLEIMLRLKLTEIKTVYSQAFQRK